MAKLYDLSVATGKYQDNTGAEKNRWKTIGSVMQNDQGGKYLLIDRIFNPAGLPVTLDNNGQPRDSVIVSMFDPKDQQKAATKKAAPQITPPDDDDVGF
jgi:hypothetical protein